MIKVDLKEMTPDYLEVLKSVFDVKGDEVLKFEDWDDLTHQAEVIGYYNALQVVINYGLENAQYIAEDFGIEKPQKNRSMASAIGENFI